VEDVEDIPMVQLEDGELGDGGELSIIINGSITHSAQP